MNGFSTGVSNKPIDFTSGAQSFMKSAVEARLNEIASSEERISKDRETVLKALSVKALPTLAREQRDRYSKEIESYRSKLIDKWKTSGKNMTTQDQIEIEDGFMDLQNRMASEVNELKQYQQAQELMYQPNFKYAYDPSKYEMIMKDAYKNLSEGKGLGDLNAKLFTAQLAPSAGDYIDKRYGEDVKSLDVESLGDFTGNVFTETNLTGLNVKAQDSIAKARRLRDVMMQDPYYKRRYTANDGTVFEAERAKAQQEIEDVISKKISESRPYKQTTGRSGGSGAQKQQLYPTTITTKRGQETWYNFPKGVSQETRTMRVENAIDAETGQPVDVDETIDYTVVGFSPESRKILVETAGGMKKVGGKPMLYDPSVDPTASQASTEGSIKSRAMTLLSNQAKDKGKWDSVTGAEVVDNGDGTYKLVGTLERAAKKNMWGNVKEKAVSEPVEVPLLPVRDEKAIRRLELDLDEYRGAISPLEKGWGIGSEDVTTVIDRRTTPKKKGDSLNLGF